MSEQGVFLRKVARENFRNAEQFVKDAETLLKKRSYAHAFALAVLGEEELAKAVMYSLAANEIMRIEGKWRSKLIKHAVKQTIALGIAQIYELILIAEDAAINAKKKAKGDVRKFRELFEEELKKLIKEEQEMFARKRGEVFEHLEHFEKLQKKREEAMYVEANLEKERISSPRNFKKSTAKSYVFHVRERLDALRYEIGRTMTDSDRKIAISTRNAVVNQFQGEQRKKVLDWYGISEQDLPMI